MARAITSLKAILVVSVAGLAFSGYLSYGELFGGCASGCPVVSAASAVGGVPACVLGFFMYLLVAVLAIVGLSAARRQK